MACMTIGARIVKGIYCHRKYEECRINVRSHVRIPLFKEMLAFAWWNMFGLFCGVLKNQGLAILLNLSSAFWLMLRTELQIPLIPIYVISRQL